MIRKLLLIMATGVLSACLITPAWAHVTVQPAEALAESFSKFVVHVPNERDDASTTKVEVKFPPLAFVGFADVEGWKRRVKMRKLDEPLEAFGESLNEVVGTVTWSGGAVEPGEFVELPFSAALPAGETHSSFPPSRPTTAARSCVGPVLRMRKVPRQPSTPLSWASSRSRVSPSSEPCTK